MLKDKLQFPTIETELAFFIGLMLASMWQLNTAITEARRVLRSCEWAGRDRNGHECCPVCGMVDTMGHDDDCDLAAMLAQEEER